MLQIYCVTHEYVRILCRRKKFNLSSTQAKGFSFLYQCFAQLRFWKSVSSKTAVAPASRFCESETLFQNRSCAKHWFKKLKPLRILNYFQGFRQSYKRPGPFRAIQSIYFRSPWIDRGYRELLDGRLRGQIVTIWKNVRFSKISQYVYEK